MSALKFSDPPARASKRSTTVIDELIARAGEWAEMPWGSAGSSGYLGQLARHKGYTIETTYRIQEDKTKKYWARAVKRG